MTAHNGGKGVVEHMHGIQKISMAARYLWKGYWGPLSTLRKGKVAVS